MSMIIHHAPQSRSTRLLWLLEELGADYRIHYVDILRREGQGRTDPANPHPLKQAPALEIDGQVLIESVLILPVPDRSPPRGRPGAGTGPIRAGRNICRGWASTTMCWRRC
ncbi:glutathione S-transferase N-terminal domain-containing protein [Brevundimonas vancanneytii]|uniref:Glutathione S-transferase, N-terminal domain n=1 Tax=Brevundimonas vancanneytii TaxID=1325724 RepID=A0A4P1K4A7_9CAUL|nr:glutathione S-transferase N-terminal domain-containing protein [Brevundimonas vancanneytii]VTO14621.1 Glutathione S-transferase, N-terminal domain [Brevundimonas vancanneytii]